MDDSFDAAILSDMPTVVLHWTLLPPEFASVFHPPSSETSESIHMAAAEILMDMSDRRGRNSIVDVRQTTDLKQLLREESLKECEPTIDEETPLVGKGGVFITTPKHEEKSRFKTRMEQIPAVLLVCLLNLMVSIPFGVAMFPMPKETQGDFPLSGKGGTRHSRLSLYHSHWSSGIYICVQVFVGHFTGNVEECTILACTGICCD